MRIDGIKAIQRKGDLVAGRALHRITAADARIRGKVAIIVGVGSIDHYLITRTAARFDLNVHPTRTGNVDRYCLVITAVAGESDAAVIRDVDPAREQKIQEGNGTSGIADRQTALQRGGITSRNTDTG